MISGRIKEGCGAGAGSSLPASPAPSSSLPGCFLGQVSPSWPRGRLPARRFSPTALLGAAGPAGLGAPGGDLCRRGPHEATPAEPEAGYRVTGSRPGPCRTAASRPARSWGTARLAHQCFGILAKTRASELSILIEIAGLGTAGGCLYQFDFCCSGEHITND